MSDQTGLPGGVRVRPVLRRRAALVLATTVLVTGGALAYTLVQQPTYTAHARVLVQPLTLPTAADHVPDMGTEQAIATSGRVLSTAAGELKVAATDVEQALDVEVAPNANILDIAYSATDRTVARDGASAVAAAYMAYRAEVGTSDGAGGPARALSTPAIATRLITPAARPAAPSSPDLVVNLLAGVVVGLIAGVGLAFAADRFGQRLRGLTSWQESVGVPVLVGLQRDAILDGAGTAAANDRAAMVQSCLRARVARSLPGGGVLLVTEVREQRERTALARSLANGLADTGWSATLIEMTQDAARSSDVVDRTGARAGHLRVRVSVTAGFGIPLRAAGDWYPTTVDSLLRLIDWHRSQHTVVVVTGPPVTTSVTTVDVAAVADAALIVDDVATARRRDALRVVDELRAAGCEVAGSVLLGLSRPRVGDPGAVRHRPAPRHAPSPTVLRDPSQVVPDDVAELVGWPDKTARPPSPLPAGLPRETTVDAAHRSAG